jgi:hypothetical protein
MQAVVIVPSDYQNPVPGNEPYVASFDGVVSGRNVVMDEDSIPPDYGVPDGNTASLRTLYTTNLTVTVLDQFGQALDSMYASSPVTETGVGRITNLNNMQVTETLGTEVSINQSLTAQGTYTDPVGIAVAVRDALGNIKYFSKGSTEAQGWADAPKLPMPAADGTSPENPNEHLYIVKVGGHQLNSRIERGTQGFPDTNRIIVYWANSRIQ